MHFNLGLNTIGAGAKLKASELNEWFKRVDRLKNLAKSFNEEDARDKLDAQIRRMNLVYKSLTGDNNPSVTKGGLH